MAGYIAAKRRIFNNQTASDAAVIGIDSEPTRVLAEELAREGGRKVVRIAVGHKVENGVYAIDGEFDDGVPRPGVLERIERAVAESVLLAERSLTRTAAEIPVLSPST